MNINSRTRFGDLYLRTQEGLEPATPDTLPYFQYQPQTQDPLRVITDSLATHKVDVALAENPQDNRVIVSFPHKGIVQK